MHNEVHSKDTRRLTLLSSTVTVKRFIPTELLEDFKQAVDGSDSTKLGIVEELKKK